MFQDQLTPPDRLLALFHSFSSAQPAWVRSPGRINLIGEHTDYNLGYVFPAAIDRFLWWGLAEASRPGCHFVAADLNESVHFLPGSYDPEAKGWVRYLQALIIEAMAAGWSVPALEGVLGGNIPVGAGLSSSAAMGTGLLYWLSRFLGLPEDRMAIARIAQKAEHRIGVQCGIMDQFAVLHGRDQQAMRLDCRSMEFDYVPLHLQDHLLLLINTKVSHELSGTAYNDRRASCERVVAAIRKSSPEVNSLRDISADMLEAHQQSLDAADLKRARYILAENERVLAAKQALHAGDLAALGQLLLQSHAGLSKEYEVSCRELDLLVELALDHPSILGARMVGGGFGGCTLNLIHQNGWQAVADDIARRYHSQTGIQPEYYPVLPAQGVTTFPT